MTSIGYGHGKFGYDSPESMVDVARPIIVHEGFREGRPERVEE